MPSEYILQILSSNPGIQRDGTTFDSDNYTGGQWTRFYEKGRPKKIGGYSLLESGTTEIVRNTYVVPRQNSVDVYLGRSKTLNVVNVSINGQASPEIDRTPVGFETQTSTIVLGNNPISTVNGSDRVIVKVPSTSDLRNGTTVTISGATGFAGILAGQFNITATITIVDSTHFSYTVAANANATIAGGGAVVDYTYTLDNLCWTFDIYTTPNVTTVSAPLANDPLEVSAASSVVIVTVPSTSALRNGNLVTIAGAVDVDTITALELNIEAPITVVDPTHFSYVSDGTATNNATGGGGAVTYSITQSVSYIVAHGAPNLLDINSDVETIIWWGQINSSSALTAISSPAQSCSGGILVVPPYLIKYGNDGVVGITDDPTDWSSAQFAAITGSKIVKALRTRGGSGAPAWLAWSINSLIRATFIGSTEIFQYDTIQDDISVLSQNAISTYNNIYFWVGVDQFYIYNGVVQRLENDFNNDWFFNNYNKTYRQKVWSLVLPRYHEWWIFYPRGDAKECSDAIMYNYQGNFWFDSVIGRTSGYAPSFYPYPLMTDSEAVFNRYTNLGQNYGLWQHEYGLNRSLYGQSLAIDSFYDTRIYTYFEQDASQDRQIRIRRIEPDFVQQEEMTITVFSRPFAQGPLTESSPYSFLPDTGSLALSRVDMTNMGREVYFRFRSNIANGDFYAGKIILGYKPGDFYP